MSITKCLECKAQISSDSSICPQCGFKTPKSYTRQLLPIYFLIIFAGFNSDFFDTSQKFFNYSVEIYKYNIPLFLFPFFLIIVAYQDSIIKAILFMAIVLGWASFTFGNSFLYTEDKANNSSSPTSLSQLLESREDISNYPIDGELASAFVLNSKHTDVQRENLLKEIKGKVIIWDVKVYEVKKIAEKVYRIQTSDSGVFFGKKVVGAFIEITAKDTLEANFIEQIKTDQITRIKGIFTGDSSARNLNIKPAILWNPESILKSDQSDISLKNEEKFNSKFPGCNSSYEIKKCEAMEEALLNEFLKDNINFQNDKLENKANSAGEKYLEKIPPEVTKYYNMYNQCMNSSEIINTDTVNACSSKATDVAKKDMNTVLEKIYIKLKNDKNMTDSLKEFQTAWELNSNSRAKSDAVNIGPPQMGITLYTLTAQRIKFLESFLNNY